MNQSRFLSATALAGTLLLAPTAVFAQTSQVAASVAAPQEDQAAQADSQEEILVTGSRIARPNLESTVPITSVTGAELAQTGNVSVGDILNNLPQLANTFSQSNSTRFLGTAGLSLLDLYSLGTQRTLVLVNGRRHVGSDILNNAVSPDVNTFPTDLIERVDVVTGGNSAIYGSDAIAGVVNFVLKDHFEGLQVHAQGGISEKGDAGSYYASILAGKNFADGRGNIAIDLEYARQNQFVASDRAYYSRNNNFVVVDTDPAGSPNGSDGLPDRVFMRDIRPASITNTGNVLFGSPTGACGRDPAGNPYTCSFIFNPDGTLTPQTGTRVGLAPNGSFLGGNGMTGREADLLQLLPQLDRYSANLIGHFEISEAFVPFIEAKYVRTDSFGTGGSGPAFFQGGTLDGFYERPALSNPYLTDQARGVITSQLIASGMDPADIDGDTRFSLRKNLLDLGVRAEEARRETYRIVAGVRGTFNDDWNYEVSANYGEFIEHTKVLGNLNVQRFLLGMDAVRNANGQIVCGSQIDPTRAYDDFAGNPAVLAADIAACQPINPFGMGNISQAAKNYVLQDTVSYGKITQLDISGFVSGNTGKFFNLPGGPIGFAIGGEYRRETNYFTEDPLVSNGYTFYNAIATLDPPAFEVKEAYAELRLPLLKDLSFAKELTVSGAGRVADYKGSTGTVYAYSVGVDYSPIQDVRFRANYSRAVRAPNLVELYSPESQNFAPGFVDPCAARQIGTGSENRAPNCAAAGIPTTFDYVYQSSLEVRSGGNPGLKEETSDSYTYGVVIQPRFIKGLSLTVDYYNIKVDDVIATLSAQNIADNCYDASDLDNQFCALFQRVAPGSTGPNGEEAYRIIEGSLLQSSVNYASLKTRGINTEISYNKRVATDTTVGLRFAWTHQIQNDSYLDPTDPSRADTIVSELASPKDQFLFDADLKTGPFFINYQMQYLSKQAVTAYEDLHTFQGRAPQNADYADILYYPDVSYHNIRLGVNITDQSNFYFGIDNLTNRMPPLYLTGIGAGSGIFENKGRYFYSGINVRF